MSSIPFSHYLCQSLKRYGVFFTEKQIRLLSFSLLCLGGFLLAQKTVSGSNLFPVPASSEAGFSAPLQSLPAVFFAKCPRMDVVLLSNEFDVSSNSLSSVVYGCIAPDRGYPPPPVPLHWLVRPCTSQCVSLLTANSLL